MQTRSKHVCGDGRGAYPGNRGRGPIGQDDTTWAYNTGLDYGGLVKIMLACASSGKPTRFGVHMPAGLRARRGIMVSPGHEVKALRIYRAESRLGGSGDRGCLVG